MAEKQSDKMAEPDGFLGMIDARILALQTLRASYVAAISIGAFGQGGDASGFGGVAPVGMGPSMAGAPMELPRGAFLNKSLPAAVRLYLLAVKRKQSIRDIATALKNGGVETTSDNFENVITGALNRMKNAGDVLRFEDGWALAEFYPESLRARLIQNSKPKEKTKKGAKKAGKSTAKKAAKAAPRAAEVFAGPSLTDRLEACLRKHGKPMKATEIAAALNAKVNVVGLTLGRLKKLGKLTQGADGAFSLV